MAWPFKRSIRCPAARHPAAPFDVAGAERFPGARSEGLFLPPQRPRADHRVGGRVGRRSHGGRPRWPAAAIAGGAGDQQAAQMGTRRPGAFRAQPSQQLGELEQLGVRPSPRAWGSATSPCPSPPSWHPGDSRHTPEAPSTVCTKGLPSPRPSLPQLWDVASPGGPWRPGYPGSVQAGAPEGPWAWEGGTGQGC